MCMLPLHALKGELTPFLTNIRPSPSCYFADGQGTFLSINHQNGLLLDQRGDPEDDNGTDDGGTELTEKAAPGDAE